MVIAWIGRRAALILLALVAGVPVLHAQGTGRSLDFDTSIRSAGMGGASEAVPWGADGNAWANPALLGYHRGIVHQWNSTPLLPELAEGLVLRSERQTVSVCGVGLSQGDVTLRYGPGGSYERSTHEGIGVSASRLADALTGHAVGGDGPLARLPMSPDVAFGYTHKRLHMVLAPGLEDGADAVDWGMLVKVTPLRVTGLLGATAWIDLAAGRSVLNADESRLFRTSGDPDGSPLSRIERDGIAARFNAGLPGSWRARMGAGWKRWLAASLEPLVELTWALDSEHVSAGGGPDAYDVSRWGGELALANVFWLRTGHVTDREGDIDGASAGWSIGYSLGGVIGYRYDHATTPVARDSGLEDTERRGWIAWLDPLALARMMR